MQKRALALVLASVLPVSISLGAVEGVGPTSKDRFEVLKSLAGTWEGPDEDRDGAPDYSIVYRPISNGNAMHATMFPGTEHEMVNVMHLSGDDLMLTHYCAGGTQPRMLAKPGDNARSIAFDFVDGANINPETDSFMGRVVLTLADENTLTERWSEVVAGEEKSAVTFELKRASATKASTESASRPAQMRYAVMHDLGPAWPEGASPNEVPGIEHHMAFLESLQADGRLVLAGPYADYSGGLIILRADSMEEAERIIRGDEAVKKGLLVPHIKPLLVVFSGAESSVHPAH